MRISGVLLVVGGWVLAVAGLLLTTSTFMRGIFACAGIAVSLVAIFGVLNQYYLARAIWKR